MKQEYLECGKIVTTHGVKGDVRMESWCDGPEVLAQLPMLYMKTPAGMVGRKVERSFQSRGQVVVHLEGINDMDTAVALRNTVLYARRADIPLQEGAVFVADMLGLPVVDADTGRVYGKLTAVEQMPSSDMYTVRTEEGDVLFPAVKEFVDRVDVDAGVFIRPIPGFFKEG